MSTVTPLCPDVPDNPDGNIDLRHKPSDNLSSMATSSFCRPFVIERFFAKYEFVLKHHLSNSDCESIKVSELLDMERGSTSDPLLLKYWEDLDLGYTESLGHPLLRAAVGDNYAASVEAAQEAYRVAKGTFADSSPLPQPQFMTVVPVEGIVMAMNALLELGDVIIAMDPCYQVLQEIARSRGCAVRKWRARVCEMTNRLVFKIDDLQRLFIDVEEVEKKRVTMLVLNAPHNPTGYHFYGESVPGQPRQVEEIVALCEKRGTILFSDEMYGRMLVPHELERKKEGASGGQKRQVFSTLAGVPNSIVLGGLSKPHGLPGLRVGWLVVTEKGGGENYLFDRLAIAKDYMTICGSAPSEILALIALKHEQQLLLRNREIVRRNMRLWADFCQKFDNNWFMVPKMMPDMQPQCCVYTLVGKKAAQRFGSVGTGKAMCEALIHEFGICITAEQCFFAPEDIETSCQDVICGVRIGLGRLAFAEAVAELDKALQKWEQQ